LRSAGPVAGDELSNLLNEFSGDSHDGLAVKCAASHNLRSFAR